ncbi:MAG: HAMP domain-containing sensor histidine kinase [Reichenbachiella sp.]|uniref:sensor histidine kinase n=1 Tax=Reichenbachiella sp. TaxID=2184521 RepID=UPI0029675861|nr:HAMP domain-containing sensor histidine kinase [Reichenbachiella sp.]MDW3208999.1 HAMP domain-containing sensor histidine kinase [Reichenbachiella sp.]
MKKKALSVHAKYTIGGVLFGLSFPVFSQFIDAWLNNIDYSLANIMLLHQQNVIHYVVDTAPLVLGVAGYLLGATHQKKNNINNRLRKINESLDTLTYKITHDLRGPALNIKNLSEILRTNPGQLPEDKKTEVINRINESIDTWLLTFEDFMTLLKHEKSGELEKKECSLERIAENVKQELANDIEKSHATINLKFDQAPTAYASEAYLNSIIKNLLSNAIKYAHPERKPEINISSEQKFNQVQITFEDNGSGIDLKTHGDKMFTLFERFSDKPNIQGSGIGLYLVKEQIEKNNGNIEVKSIPNEGTIFTIHLPITT